MIILLLNNNNGVAGSGGGGGGGGNNHKIVNTIPYSIRMVPFILVAVTSTKIITSSQQHVFSESHSLRL